MAPADPEAQYTAASVFAHFPSSEAPEQAKSAANDARKPGRSRFAQQFVRSSRRNVV